MTSSPPRIGSEAPALFTSDDVENMPSSPIRLNVLDEEDAEDDRDDVAEGPSSPILITPTKRRRIEMEFPPSSPPGMGMAMSSSPLKRFDTYFPAGKERDEEEDDDDNDDEEITFNLDPPTPAGRRQPRLTKLHESITLTPTSSPPQPQPHLQPTTRKYVPGQRIKRSRALLESGPAQLFVRSISGRRHDRFALAYPGHNSGWQDDVENFYSNVDDIHTCTHPDDYLSLPLCTAPCNTNSLIAIGEESGEIRLIDPSPDTFSTPHLTFPVHDNAILDLSFSASDAKLATAAGDQTARIIDMPTQQTIAILTRHTSSLKKVCWQDASQEQVLATCSRDGAVAVWDLRVKCSSSRPVMEIGEGSEEDEAARLDIDLLEGSRRRSGRGMMVKEYTQPLNFIAGAHSEKLRVRSPYASSANPHSLLNSSPNNHDSSSSLRDTSVTSLLFLPAPRSNMLVTSGASDACLRLWDLRTTYALRRKAPVPLAVTSQPESHSRNRQFGITSMDLSTDGSRLYALCRDKTVYVYSTRHLVVEGAGEETTRSGGYGNSGAGFKHFPGEEARMGLGPLYGLRHPRLSVSTFFVKLAVRKERDGQREVLAVGSSDNCAVVFSTDERYMRRRRGQEQDEGDGSAMAGKGVRGLQMPITPTTPSRRSTLRPSTLSQSPSAQNGSLPTPFSNSRRYTSTPASKSRSFTSRDTLPIYNSGVALTGAHKKEVSALCFSHSGELITVSDDCSARCWREDSEKAWQMRTFGVEEGGGNEGGAGWVEFGGEEDGEEGWFAGEGREVGGMFSDMTVGLSQSQSQGY